jgi:hypothetical protein
MASRACASFGRSDGAGIEDDDVGALRGLRRGGATVKELTLDGGAVGVGGAATELFDEEGGHRQ